MFGSVFSKSIRIAFTRVAAGACAPDSPRETFTAEVGVMGAAICGITAMGLRAAFCVARSCSAAGWTAVLCFHVRSSGQRGGEAHCPLSVSVCPDDATCGHVCA